MFENHNLRITQRVNLIAAPEIEMEVIGFRRIGNQEWQACLIEPKNSGKKWHDIGAIYHIAVSRLRLAKTEIRKQLRVIQGGLS